MMQLRGCVSVRMFVALAAIAGGAFLPHHAARAVVMAHATPPDFSESLAPVGSWTGVGVVNRQRGVCSGALISETLVLTAAHCFFRNSDGTGDQVVGDRGATFQPIAGGPNFLSTQVFIHPDYNSAVGHRIGGNDIAIFRLAIPVRTAEVYGYNRGQIVDERDPANVAVKVGFGLPGNGDLGAVPASLPTRRVAENIVDQFGDGRTTWHAAEESHYRNLFVTPPAHTLVYDFDDPENPDPPLTDLLNHFSVSNRIVGDTEGIPAAGDSGGPLFQFFEHEPIIVGLTSSSLSSIWAGQGDVAPARFGDVAFDTRVRDFSGWIDQILEIDEPPTAVLVAMGLAALPFFASGGAVTRRSRARASGSARARRLLAVRLHERGRDDDECPRRSAPWGASMTWPKGKACS